MVPVLSVLSVAQLAWPHSSHDFRGGRVRGPAFVALIASDRRSPCSIIQTSSCATSGGFGLHAGGSGSRRPRSWLPAGSWRFRPCAGRSRPRPARPLAGRRSQAASQAPESFIQQARRALATGRAGRGRSARQVAAGGRCRRRSRAGAGRSRREANTTKRWRLLEPASQAESLGRSRAAAGLVAPGPLRARRCRRPSISTACWVAGFRLQTPRRCFAPRARRRRSAGCRTPTRCIARRRAAPIRRSRSPGVGSSSRPSTWPKR